MTMRELSPLGAAGRGIVWAAVLLSVSAFGRAASWTTGGPAAAPISALTTDASTSQTLYAAASIGSTGGFFVSTNAGATWRAGTPLSQSILTLATSAPHAIYAGTEDGVLAKSTDGGTTWQQVTFHPVTAVTQVLVDPQNPLILYQVFFNTVSPGGIFPPLGDVLRSTDGGLTWLSIKPGLGAPATMAADPRATGTLYAAAATGFFKSTTFGSTWSAAGAGLGAQVVALAVSPLAPSIVYAGTVMGVYKSSDAGRTFALANTGLPLDRVTALAVDPVTPNRIFAGVFGRGVFVSTDAGGMWVSTNDGLGNLDVTTLAIDALGGFLHAGTEAGVYDLQLTPATTEMLSAILPVVISAAGANSSVYRTTVQLRHPSDTPSDAPIMGRFVFHSAGGTGTSIDAALAFTLLPGSVLAIADLLPALGSRGLGSVDVFTTSGPTPVGLARIFNDAGLSGTTGCTEELIIPADALNSGDRAILIAPLDLRAFRFNIGVRTLGAGAVIILTVHSAQGQVTRTATRSFPPHFMTQLPADAFITDDSGGTAGPPLSANDSVTIQVVSGNAMLYAATADNTTNDPSLQLSKRVR